MLDMADDVRDAWAEFINKIIIEPNGWENLLVQTIDSENEEMYGFCYTSFRFINSAIIEAYLRLMFPPLLLPMGEKILQSIRDESETNIAKIIDILHSHKAQLLPESMSDIDVYSKEFKEICQTVIYLPRLSHNLLSGVYIIFIYYETCSSKKQTIGFVWKAGLLKNVPIEVQENDTTYYNRQRNDAKQKIFFLNDRSYLKKLENKLSISIDCSRSRHRPLWNLLDLYGYATHDIGEMSPKSQKIPFAEGMLGILFDGSINSIPINNRNKIFFLSVLMHKMTEFKDMEELFFDMQTIFSRVSFIERILSVYLQAIMAADQSEGFQHAEAYQDAINGWKQWIQDKISQISQGIKTDGVSSSMPVITVTEENLYEIVYWRTILSEYSYCISILGNTMLFRPKSCEQNNQLRLYLASRTEGKIGVGEWCAFREKFRHQLKAFFPKTIDDELKECWIYASAALLCCFPERYGLPIASITYSGRISEIWLKNYENYIRAIGVGDIFAMMHIFTYSSELLVETKGAYTPFFHRMLEQPSGKKSRQKKLQDILKGIKTHYMSHVRPDNYHLLTFYVMRWLIEQQDAFLIAEEVVSLLRAFERFTWSRFRQDILCTSSIEDCKKGTEALLKLLTDLLHDFPQKCKETESTCPGFKKFFEGAFLDMQDEPSEESKAHFDFLSAFLDHHHLHSNPK